MDDGIYPVTIPKWGIEMQEGTIVQWHVAEGGEINRGEELIDIETDKIVNTVESPRSGILRRRIAEDGVTLKVGALLGVIAPAEVEDSAIERYIQEFKPATASASEKAESGTAPGTQTPVPPPPSRTVEAAAAMETRRVRVSPAAALRARELGVDINLVSTTGRRISPEDVERYAREHGESGAAEAGDPAYEARPMSATRKTIARRLVEAKQQIPHFYLSIDINMEAALGRREKINTGGIIKVSVNDVVMRASILALQAVPDVNIHLVEDEIRRFRHVNLAMAVATERGIITPVIHQSDSLSITQLAEQAAKQGEKARNGSLSREDLDGGTFTVSNLGMFGINDFKAIINPPQGAILAVGVCEERIIPEGNEFAKARMMRATLSCDHRAIDGALGAQFLSELKAALENPTDL